MGHRVISSWLDEVECPPGMSEAVFNKKLGVKDTCEVYAADLLILDMSTKKSEGKSVEFGLALADHQNKLIFGIGEKRSVFHELLDRHFVTWEECLEEIRTLHYDQKILAYLAGILDGEGCVRFKTRMTSIYPTITIGMTTKEPLVRFQALFGGTFFLAKPKNTNWKSCWMLNLISPNKVKRCLQVLQPFLLVKHRQAALALDFLNNRTIHGQIGRGNHIPPAEKQWRDGLVEQMNALNKTGARGRHGK
jgi:hypothetical protein